MNQFINLFYTIYNFFMRYPTPPNLGSVWNFGVAALMFFVLQFITGIFLSMSYIANSELAFLSVENIMRNINFGWLLRYLHSTGASFFFLCVYIHTFRNLYYVSFNKVRYAVWAVGVFILILMITTAFTGYVLPWGQMSYWAATVITNLFSAIPYFGDQIVIWLWGGYAVNTATLNRFFSFHFLLPFLMFFFIIIHFVFLHERGSSNNLSVIYTIDKLLFHPFFVSKDMNFLIYIFFIFSIFVGFYPNYLLHPDNYILADPLSTPSHIVPEWYFLPFYAILRCVPNKSLGIILLALSLIVLFLFPLFMKKYSVIENFKSSTFYQVSVLDNNITKIIFIFIKQKWVIYFWLFVVSCIGLGIMGGLPITEINLFWTRIIVFFYFFYLGSALIRNYSFINFIYQNSDIFKLLNFFTKLIIFCIDSIPFLINLFLLKFKRNRFQFNNFIVIYDNN